MAVEKISSLDSGYVSGMLSLFPEALDDYNSLYRATNNAKIPLKNTLTYNGRRVIVEDTSLFPETGMIRIGPEFGIPGTFEIVYYSKKTAVTFEGLIRGFAGSKQSHWTPDNIYVSNAVFAEHKMAIKDAILKLQGKMGLEEAPDELSLNGILKAQEVRFLAPKPLYRAFPIKGPPSLKVRFQNFSTGHIIRYLWDFGDGGSSLEKSPSHVYTKEGKYTVKLNVVTSSGAQGIATKTEYIEVNEDESVPFFYVASTDNPYSQKTADENDLTPKTFVFVDQSDGDIVQRNWIFGDGEKHTEEDPDKHEITHIYAEPGEYIVSQLIQFANGRLKRTELPETLIVI
jgi:PKD repeat protein